MSETEGLEWECRYADGDYRPRTRPSPFLEEWIDRFPVGRALDVACGAGRNALLLAAAGHRVEAVDISPSAIDMARAESASLGLDVAWKVADLDSAELSPSTYDVITMIRYVNRKLWPRLVAALAPNGWLLIEHHMQTTADVHGPSSPEFRLAPQELLEPFRSLRIISYQETLETDQPDARRYALERMVACKGNPGW